VNQVPRTQRQLSAPWRGSASRFTECEAGPRAGHGYRELNSPRAPHRGAAAPPHRTAQRAA